MPMLHGAHVYFVPLQRSNAFSGCPGSGHRSNGRNAASNGGAADGLLIKPGFGAVRCIHHKLYALTIQPGLLQPISSTMRGYQAESKLYKAPRQFNRLLLVTINHADEDRAARRQRLSGRELRFSKGLAKGIG